MNSAVLIAFAFFVSLFAFVDKTEAADQVSWSVQYFNNTDMSGKPVVQEKLTQQAGGLKVDNGSNAPTSGVNKDNFSAVYTSSQTVPAGKYILRTRADDGIRVYIDGKKIVDDWSPSSYWKSEKAKVITISDNKNQSNKQLHEIKVEYYDKTNGSGLEVYLHNYSQETEKNNWLGLYYNNNSFSGTPVYVEGGSTSGNQQSQLFFDWDREKPNANTPADNFSATYYKKLQGGKDYFVQTYADDQVTAKVGDKTVINQNYNSSGEINTGIATGLASGDQIFQVNYKENTGRAKVAADAAEFGDWVSWYYDNTKLSGMPKARQVTEGDGFSLKVENGTGAPISGIGKDNFSANYSTAQHIDAGTYYIRTRADDGMRVYIDDKLVVDSWDKSSYWKSEQIHAVNIKDKQTSANKDVHTIRIEYYELSNGSGLEFYLNKASEEATEDGWFSTYYNNTNFSGLPAIIEGGATAGTNVKKLFYNWERDKPFQAINADNFTARYYRLLDGSKDYFVQTIADDRVKAEVNGKTVINRWSNSSGVVDTGIITDLKSGSNVMSVDYMESTGRARVAGEVVPLGNWIALYYNNTKLSGFPAAQNTISGNGTSLKVENGYGSPVNEVGGDYFSASYATAQRIKAGNYVLRTRADDGMRVYLDGKLVMDNWESSSYWASEKTKVISVKDREDAASDQKDIHTIQIEYYEQTKGSGLEFYLEPADNLLEKDSWVGLYYNNKSLSGTPVKAVGGNNTRQKVDAVSYNWGTGKPYSEVNADNFSARYMKLLEGGKDYFIQTNADDGIRVNLDDERIIDRWSNSSGKTDFATITGLKNGDHKLSIDYFENTGEAAISANIGSFGDWIASYYNNTNLSGNPKVQETISGDGSSLKVENGKGSPAEGINSDNFSASYETATRIKAGRYLLRSRADDGMRIYIDGKEVVNEWEPSSYWKSETTDYIDIKDTGSGSDKDVHKIRIEYYDKTNGSGLEFYLHDAEKEVEADSWFAQFYPNSTLSGDYVQTVGGATSGNKLDQIAYNWDRDKPFSNMNADNFSASFTKKIAGNNEYFAQTYADDGVRMSIDGKKVIDEWGTSSGKLAQAFIPTLSNATHTVKTDYYEASGRASFFANVEPLGNWIAYYYNNSDTSGTPANAKVITPNEDSGFTEDHAYDAPMDNVEKNNYSARYVTAKRLTAGDYYLEAIADDGVQVLVDGQVVLDRWSSGNNKKDAAKVTIKNGDQGTLHWIEVRYLEETGKSNIDFSIKPYKESDLYHKDAWTLSYYPNIIDPDKPVSSDQVVKIEEADDIDFDWQYESPTAGIPANRFSIIMQKQINISKAGNYDFTLDADDGVRLEVDGKVIIDSWNTDKGLREEKAKYMDAGWHDVKIYYYENTGRANVSFTFKESVKKEIVKEYSSYSLSLDAMTDLQMKAAPKTDTRYDIYLREDAIYQSGGSYKVNGSDWNVRTGPGTQYGVHDGRFRSGDIVSLLSSSKDSQGYTWYKLGGWVPPTRTDLKYQINPDNFQSTLQEQLQFAKLSDPGSINVSEVNDKVLNGKGILAGKAASFQKGAEEYGVNAVYLISHAILETGNGSSQLAKGYTYNGKTVYNMYGIGANDNNALLGGAKLAYDRGWFTPEAAIIGGAEFVRKDYIDLGQDTIYKMRWNPEKAVSNGYATHQYATDIGWASKQTYNMYKIYNILDSYSITLDIPKYK
ncbi:PA14 domain-containing protein [Terribacillus saccharophilus]|uniref:PA14 domain-containing protein n=1 Tax=Terribacillus saccharophilus TaxID=361277 RepID=A0ABX4GY28_9BACI|nr:PA14 domain-containing protein [Terribacillus saccharophilus]PAD35218.1 hypothetical protein CHH56_10755 [Terribacillus saccharophilus]PAD95967.1 hypothetical protein CHH50_10950 [Terribacillus saccharophilus]PAD99709.1 hypothetical protein CHH48_10685 [Terribacillus saccharophilus]